MGRMFGLYSYVGGKVKASADDCLLADYRKGCNNSSMAWGSLMSREQPSKASEDKGRLERFFKSSAGLITSTVAFLTALVGAWTFFADPIRNHFNNAVRAAIVDVLLSEEGSKIADRWKKSGTFALQGSRETTLADWVFGYSINFAGSDIIKQRRPQNRAYFFADAEYTIDVHVYFSGTKKFPIDLKIDGILVARSIHDARQIQVQMPRGAGKVASLDPQFLPPTEEADRPKFVHYIEISPVDGYKFTAVEVHEVSGIILVTRPK